MKRVLRVSVLFFFIILILSSCVHEDASIQNKEEQKSEVQQFDDVQQNNSQYQTDEYSFVIPKTWEGKYVVKDFEQGQAFYSKAIYDINSTGNLFDIASTSTVGDWRSYPDYKFLGCADERFYFATFPTDVQFDVGNNDLSDEYSVMQQDIDIIIDSFILYGNNVSYEEPNDDESIEVVSKVEVDLNYIGIEIDKIVEDAVYTGGIVVECLEETVLPYLKSYEPLGGEVYYIYSPKDSTGRNYIYFAVIDGRIVAAGFLMEDSNANVYQLIRGTLFADNEPLIDDDGNEGKIKNLIWSAQNGYLNIRTMPIDGVDYKGWLIMNYSFEIYTK